MKKRFFLYSLFSSTICAQVADAATSGTACQYPSALIGADSTFLRTGNNTQIPRFDVNLTNLHDDHSVKNATTTLGYPATHQQTGTVDTRYIPTSVTELTDPTGVFRTDFSMSGAQGEYTTINGVSKLSVRTEPWSQPMAFNLAGNAGKSIYINQDPTQGASLQQQAHYGWCDVSIRNTDSAVTRQQVTLSVLSPYQQMLVDLGIDSDPNPTKTYSNLAYLELTDVDLSFDQGLSILAQDPTNLNHSQSLSMSGGSVVSSTTGSDVIIKLINSSVNFEGSGGVTTAPSASNPSHLTLWVAPNSTTPTASTSQISFGTNTGMLPTGASTKVFVDSGAALVLRDTGLSANTFIFPNYSHTVAGWTDTTWQFSVGTNATLEFQNSYVDFGEHKNGGIGARSSVTLSPTATLKLTGSGSSVVVDDLNYAGFGAGDAASVTLSAANSYLEATDLNVNNGELVITASPTVGDYYFQNIYLRSGNLSFAEGKKNAARIRRWDLVNVDVLSGTNTLNFSNWAGDINIGPMLVRSDLTVNVEGNASDAGTVSFLSEIIVMDSQITPEFNLTQHATVEFDGTTFGVNSQGWLEGTAKVDINLAPATAVTFEGENSNTFAITSNPTALKSYSPVSTDPINLGPSAYHITSSSGVGQVKSDITLNNEVFLNSGFGADLAANTQVVTGAFSILMIGDSCSPGSGQNCTWERGIGSVQAPRFAINAYTAMFYDISLDAAGNAINDHISTRYFDSSWGSTFVINTLPVSGTSQLPTASELNGKTFNLMSSSEPAASKISTIPSLLAGDSLPAATKLFWLDSPGTTKQFIIGAETDLAQLQHKSGTRNQRGVGQLLTLTGAVAASSTTPAASVPIGAQHQAISLNSGTTLASALNTLTTSQWNQLNQYHAEPFASYMTVGLEQNLMVSDTVMDHAVGAGEFIDNVLSGLPASAGQVGINPQRPKPLHRLWGDIQYSNGTVDSQNDLAGFDYQLGAIEFGTDIWDNGTSTLGAFAGLGFTQMTSSDGASTSFSSQGVNLGLYGRHKLSHGMNLSGMIGLDYNFIQSSRQVASVGSFQGGTAKSDYNSWGAFAGIRLDRPIEIKGPRSYITPVAELTYAGQNFGSVSESGAGDLGYNIDAASADALVGGVGFDLSHSWEHKGISYAIDALFRYEYDFFANSNSEHSVNVQSQLTGYQTSVFGIDRGSQGLSAGLGLAVQVSQDTTLSVAYKYTDWSHGTQHQVGANFTMLW